MPEPWEFVPLQEAAAFLNVSRDTLRQYVGQRKYGLLGVKALRNPNGGLPSWLAVRWDTVLGFKAKRNEIIKQRSAAGGKRSRGAHAWDGGNRCPICSAVSPGDVLCDLCRELEHNPYYHRRTAIDAPSCRNGRVLGVVP